MANCAEAENIPFGGNLYHVFLVGFHHKKGCIVEYAYPPLGEGSGDKTSLPEQWKFLPNLAMPDGAHNYVEDVVYFHLPARQERSKETVYCVSYCRQVDSNLLTNKDDGITRGTVQKSVVILSRVPAYGLIHAKLKLPVIANAFLENFSNKHVLKELYDHINSSLSISDESHLFFGLSARKLLINFRHKLLMLFKLILLEKRVIFYATPASELVTPLLSLLSLYPRMIEIGLSECTAKESPIEAPHDNQAVNSIGSSLLQSNNTNSTPTRSNLPLLKVESDGRDTENELLSESLQSPDEIVIGSLQSNESQIKPPQDGLSINRTSGMASRIASKFGFLNMSSPKKTSEQLVKSNDSSEYNHLDPENDEDDNSYFLNLSNARLEMDVDSPEKTSKNSPRKITSESIHYQIPVIEEELQMPSFSVDDHGFPLNIFVGGNMCLPYVSLQHHDVLSHTESFVVGATNILFKTRKELSDVVVDIENCELSFSDFMLQKQLTLTAADLRFSEHIVSSILEVAETDDFFDATTEWKGGDEWLRSLFAEYLHRMLSVSLKDDTDTKFVHDYNESFISAWKCTKNYRIWKRGNHKISENTEDCQHPFHAQYSISDVRLRLHHKLQSSEQGRKIEGAISNANDTIVSTGRYIGSAIGSAKSSLGSWFSSKLSTNKS